MDRISACGTFRPSPIHNFLLVPENMIPSIPSLERYDNAFGITLSQFFSTGDENYSLTSRQKELLKEAGHLTDEQQAALIAFFRTL